MNIHLEADLGKGWVTGSSFVSQSPYEKFNVSLHYSQLFISFPLIFFPWIWSQSHAQESLGVDISRTPSSPPFLQGQPRKGSKQRTDVCSPTLTKTRQTNRKIGEWWSRSPQRGHIPAMASAPHSLNITMLAFSRHMQEQCQEMVASQGTVALTQFPTQIWTPCCTEHTCGQEMNEVTPKTRLKQQNNMLKWLKQIARQEGKKIQNPINIIEKYMTSQHTSGQEMHDITPKTR